MQIRTLIIDDYKSLRESLKHLLNEFCPSVLVVGEAEGIDDGIEQITNLNPELVFLDVKLGNATSFDLLSKLVTIDFKIIFVTAFDEYALRAFKFNAINYLLKPIDTDELIDAVQRASVTIEKEQISDRVRHMFENISADKSHPKKIVLKTAEQIHSVNVHDIIRCESDKNYTSFYLTGNKKIVVSITLKEYDDLLTPCGFYRTHQSHLINLDYFDYFVKKDGGMAIMKDKAQVPISSRKKDEFLKIIHAL
ncbi:MAG: response regulator transcription factor [Bacteroidia bacterium]|nr:response regulator transcription factor [Bacteroidia bacterium]